ncbi:RNA polymerase sigma-70 factor, ECF subfamily [Chitinophaga sp. CF118]|uniref:RNA polymerase sigma-70 factor n=1 Tax=Chitinophaga sp. CF118 TaxID=1884367 RepID=UPI0008E7490F|nr:RNA polymerase sigma-70 factor [Chitinophaga sp. CF118]SFD14162.1 RNA polymerase sigma-70 factor, ECF subfamily [Chitinophaga sp. CF118]
MIIFCFFRVSTSRRAKIYNIIKKLNTYSEAELITLLIKGDRDAYECIYNDYWSRLYAYVYNRLKTKEAAEEIIQEVFFSLWTRRAELTLTHSLTAYLFTAVKYQVFNYIKADKVRRTYASHFSRYEEKMMDNSNQENIELSDLTKAVEKEVARLPEKCQQVFRMSRNEHRSIRDIAETLNISHKTVENHLTRALRQLRVAFSDHFWFF